MRKTNQQRINLRRQTTYDNVRWHLSEFIDGFGDLPDISKYELLRSVRSFYNAYVDGHYFTTPQSISQRLIEFDYETN